MVKALTSAFALMGKKHGDQAQYSIGQEVHIVVVLEPISATTGLKHL